MTEENTSTKRWSFSGVIQIAVILTIVGGGFYFARAPSVADDANDHSGFDPDAQHVPTVQVMLPRRYEDTPRINTTGMVTARDYISLTSQVTGRVVWVSDSLRAGGEFDSDEVLLKVDPEDFELALASAESDLRVANSTLELQRAESVAAKENYAILNANEPVPDLVAKVPQINQSLARVAVAENQVKSAELALRRTEFSLPFRGRVTSTQAAEGQLVTAGQPFGQAYATNSLEVTFSLGEEEVSLLEPMLGRLSFVQSNGVRFSAKVARRSADLDTRSRMTTVYLSFTESVPFRPGKFVDVSIAGHTIPDSYLVPDTAMRGNSLVWIVEQGAIRSVDLVVRGRIDDSLIVQRFNYGDGVILGSAQGAEVGDPVRAASADRI